MLDFVQRCFCLKSNTASLHCCSSATSCSSLPQRSVSLSRSLKVHTQRVLECVEKKWRRLPWTRHAPTARTAVSLSLRSLKVQKLFPLLRLFTATLLAPRLSTLLPTWFRCSLRLLSYSSVLCAFYSVCFALALSLFAVLFTRCRTLPFCVPVTRCVLLVMSVSLYRVLLSLSLYLCIYLSETSTLHLSLYAFVLVRAALLKVKPRSATSFSRPWTPFHENLSLLSLLVPTCVCSF